MEQRWIVHTYENQYSGLHGIENWFVCECSKHEVVQVAIEDCVELQENYACIADYNVDQACEIVGIEKPNYGNPDFLSALHEVTMENCAFNIYEVDPQCGLSDRELEELLSNDPYSVIEVYTVTEEN